MAREIFTKIWCDSCMERGERTEGKETPPIAIGNAKPRVLALCEVDMKGIYEPLKNALTELGQIIPAGAIAAPRVGGQSAPSRTATAGIECPLGCGTVLQNRESLNGHTTRVHDKTLNEVLVEMKIDTLYDVDGVEVPGPRPEKEPEVKEAKCDQPDCDKVYTFPKYRRPVHALSIHLSQAHGITKADREKAAAKKTTTAKKTTAKS